MGHVKEAWRNLYSTKQRTLLALLGIVIGIGSVIALVSIGQIISHEASARFRALGTDLMRLELDADEFDALRTTGLFEGLAHHTPCLRHASGFVINHYMAENGRELRIVGVMTGFNTAAKIKMREGRFIHPLDGNRHYVVLGSEASGILQPEHIKDAARSGNEILIGDTPYTAIGVLEAVPPLQQVVRDMNQAVYVPIQTQLTADDTLQVEEMIARMYPGVDVGRCIEQVQLYFKRRSRVVTAEVETADQLIEEMRQQSDLYAVLLAAIGSISLIVGGVGIMNIMLVSVSERRQEIGIRRALGAKRRDIRRLFLSESILLAGVGGALGIATGVAITFAFTLYRQWEFFLSAEPILLSFGLSAVIGIFFGFFPARQAAAVDPIKALRSE